VGRIFKDNKRIKENIKNSLIASINKKSIE
jgi:hypothetical protein